MDELTADIQKLQDQVNKASLPADLKEKVDGMLSRLTRQFKSGGSVPEFDQTAHYIDWIINLPWNTATKDILDLKHTRTVLDSHHYGLDDLKQRILEYTSVLVLNEAKNNAYHAPILLLVGLVGTGKTTLAASIAEALGRKFVRIPFGGMSSALDLRGQSRAYPDAEPGQIIKNIRRAGAKNPPAQARREPLRRRRRAPPPPAEGSPGESRREELRSLARRLAACCSSPNPPCARLCRAGNRRAGYAL